RRLDGPHRGGAVAGRVEAGPRPHPLDGRRPRRARPAPGRVGRPLPRDSRGRLLRVSLPRLLTIMGSGETSPTMSKVHRSLFERLGPPPVPAVLLDTPVGFQENADDISSRAVEYFKESVGRDIAVASWKSATASSPLDYETMLARVREARYV